MQYTYNIYVICLYNNYVIEYNFLNYTFDLILFFASSKYILLLLSMY